MQLQMRAGRARPVSGWALLTAPGTLSNAAQQHLVQHYCSGCHNFEDYTSGTAPAAAEHLISVFTRT
jgi:hypothetical protein